MLIDFIYIVIAIIVIVSSRLPKLWKHLLHGSFLASYGMFHVLAYARVYPLPFIEKTFLVYVVAITIISVGSSLCYEGFRTRGKFGYSSLAVGAILLITAILPTLNQMRVVNFGLPQYPIIIAYFVYAVSGFFLIASTLVIYEFRN